LWLFFFFNGNIYLKNQKNTIRPNDGSQQLKAFAAISSDGSLHAWGDPAAGGSLDVAWLKYVTAVWCCKMVGSPDYSNRFLNKVSSKKTTYVC